MNDVLSIKGKVISDERQLERYASDLSHYYIRPRLVAIPLDEHDVMGRWISPRPMASP